MICVHLDKPYDRLIRLRHGCICAVGPTVETFQMTEKTKGKWFLKDVDNQLEAGKVQRKVHEARSQGKYL